MADNPLLFVLIYTVTGTVAFVVFALVVKALAREREPKE